MAVTDEMIAAARRVLHADVDPSGWVDDGEMRAALEAALSAAPPSDDYRRGLEDAAKYMQTTLPHLSLQEYAAAIRALGEKK